MKILAKDGHQCFKVLDEHRGDEHRVHVRRMRLVNVTRDADWARFTAEKHRNQSYQYGVQAVTDMRSGPSLKLNSADVRFRVKWEGYEDDHYETWIPNADFTIK